MNQWQQVIGHDWAVELLQAAITHQRVGHAYLFTGPAHVGKTTLATIFAQALNCEAEEAAGRPCGECRSCRLIAAGRHPDVRLLEPEISGRGVKRIKIEPIRQLQQDLSLTATEARYKIAILTEFESANANAANAFLKTLEEPPPNVILLLTALEADALLPTISSRCRTVSLRPLPVAQIQAALETRWQIASDEALLLAHLADGRLGWAVAAAEDSQILEQRRQQLELLQDILQKNRVERFDLADRLAKQAETLPDLLRTWSSWWRDLVLLIHHPGTSVPINNVDQQHNLRHLTQIWGRQEGLQSLTQTETALWQLERNANTRLVLENLLLTYPLAGGLRSAVLSS